MAINEHILNNLCILCLDFQHVKFIRSMLGKLLNTNLFFKADYFIFFSDTVAVIVITEHSYL